MKKGLFFFCMCPLNATTLEQGAVDLNVLQPTAEVMASRTDEGLSSPALSLHSSSIAIEIPDALAVIETTSIDSWETCPSSFPVPRISPFRVITPPPPANAETPPPVIPQESCCSLLRKSYAQQCWSAFSLSWSLLVLSLGFLGGMAFEHYFSTCTAV